MAELEACVFRSKPFVFEVGEKATEYTVHQDIIAKQSEALKVLVQGGMAEALNERATFEDLDDDTFVRFCQYAYTGDYYTPAFISDPDVILSPVPYSVSPSVQNYASDHEIADPPPDAEFGGSDINFGFKTKKSKQQWKSRLLRQSLDDKDYDIMTALRISSARCEVRSNSSHEEDYTPVLLGHARLYAFGEKWGIDNLKILALHKLHETLTTFTLFQARRRDIVELLRYTYSNEHTPDRGEEVDELRSLVMVYVGCEAESLTQCPEFTALLRDGGKLAEDFVQILMKRIE